MKKVDEMPLHAGTFIAEQAELTGYYTDCYGIELGHAITLPEFINAFYTTPLFRLERLILALTPKGRMKDADVTALSSGESDNMSVWKVEGRRDSEILLSAGRTKSWLMVVPSPNGSLLFFGSVVVSNLFWKVSIWLGCPLSSLVKSTSTNAPRWSESKIA